VACVSDSYDIRRACREYWGKKLKDKVLARDGVLVVRPDSGEPHVIVPEVIGDLGDAFGLEPNEKGYNTLNPKVRVIQGDGCNHESIRHILTVMRDNKLSADNIAFGMGGGLLQQCNRDTQRFAFKCSAVRRPTKRGTLWEDVFKAPNSDLTKASKRGRLKLIEEAGTYITVMEDSPMPDVLETVFENGDIVKTTTLDEIRERAKIEVRQPAVV
jgi:nicotinamide phosphoribosyltransferase